MRLRRSLVLLIVFAMLTSSVCFAGSWHTDPFAVTMGPGSNNPTQFTVKEFTCTNMPCLDYWVNPSAGTKTITVKLYNWDYVKVGTRYQWTWNLVQTNTHTVSSGQYAHFSDWSNFRIYQKAKYEILFTGTSQTDIDGNVKYYY